LNKPDRRPSEAKVLRNTYLHQQGIGIEVSFDKGREVLRQGIAARLESMTGGHKAEYMLARTQRVREVPLMELLDQEVPQFMIHGLVNSLAITVAEGLRAQQSLSMRKNTLKVVTVLGSAGLAGGSLELVSSEIDPSSLPPEKVALLIALAYSATALGFARKALKMYLKNDEILQTAFQKRAADRANQVGEDIHHTYCAAHFDRQAEAALSPPTSPKRRPKPNRQQAGWRLKT
jgi:hypothetical protein